MQLNIISSIKKPTKVYSFGIKYILPHKKYIYTTIGTNKYEHQYLHHQNWIFRYLYNMYDNEIHGSIYYLETMQIIELLFSFPITIYDFITITLHVYKTYDYLRQSTSVVNFLQKITLIYDAIRLHAKRWSIYRAFVSCPYKNVYCINILLANLDRIETFYEEKFIEYTELSNKNEMNFYLDFNKQNIMKNFDDILIKLDNYKIRKIKYIEDQHKRSLKHDEYAKEECDVVIKLLTYIETSKKYNVFNDFIVENLIYKIPKYNYFISTNYSSVTFKSITSYTPTFSHGFSCEEKISLCRNYHTELKKKFFLHILDLCDSD
jgi:hypothetical protein